MKTNTERMLEALETGAKTAPELSCETGLTLQQIHSAMTSNLRMRRVQKSGYKLHGANGGPVISWALAPGSVAPVRRLECQPEPLDEQDREGENDARLNRVVSDISARASQGAIRQSNGCIVVARRLPLQYLQRLGDACPYNWIVDDGIARAIGAVMVFGHYRQCSQWRQNLGLEGQP